MASWFETHGVAVLLIMRVSDLILRRRVSAVSKDEANLKIESEPLFEQRRARHEGVERRPELRAIAVLLLQNLVPGAGDHQMRAGAQVISELLDRRGRDDGVVAGGEHQDRLADFRWIIRRAEAVH